MQSDKPKSKEKGDSFTVQAIVDGKSNTITITTAETSDGISYYICYLKDKQITQIRQDQQEWSQIWGELNDDDVKAIGVAIEKIIQNE